MRVTPIIARALELVDTDSLEAVRLLARYGLALSSTSPKVAKPANNNFWLVTYSAGLSLAASVRLRGV